MKSHLLPRTPPEAVKKSGGMEFGGRYHVQRTAKICLPKEALISCLSAVYELMPEAKWKSYFIYTGSSNGLSVVNRMSNSRSDSATPLRF